MDNIQQDDDYNQYIYTDDDNYYIRKYSDENIAIYNKQLEPCYLNELNPILYKVKIKDTDRTNFIFINKKSLYFILCSFQIIIGGLIIYTAIILFIK